MLNVILTREYLATWPSTGHKFPVLKCKSFIFEAKGYPMSVRKWSDVLFDVSDFLCGWPWKFNVKVMKPVVTVNNLKQTV